MESLVINHKKIVNALMYAFTFGLSLPLKGKGYFFRHESEDDFYQIQLWRSATKPENGDAKLIMDHSISKNAVEMNDNRIHNISKFLENECRGFVSTCMGRMIETPKGEPSREYVKEHQLDAIAILNEMCDQSLDPDTHNKWEEVREMLYKNRNSLNKSDSGGHFVSEEHKATSIFYK